MATKQKILIVDDDNNIAELVALYLTKECFETRGSFARGNKQMKRSRE